MDAHYHSFIADLEALETEIRAGLWATLRQVGLITTGLVISLGFLMPETLARFG